VNDLKVLEDLGTALDPRSAEPPAELRRRVMHSTLPKRRRTRRLRTVLAGGLAVATAGFIVVAQLVATPPRAQAEEVLDRAASYAQELPVAQNNQFLYVESLTAALTGPVDSSVAGKVEVNRRQVWLSVDGTKDGLIRTRPVGGAADAQDLTLPGCIDGESTQKKGPDVITTPCTPTPGYVSGLPEDPDAMLAYLRAKGAGTKSPTDEGAFQQAGELLRESSLAPATMAALFQALAKVPGTEVKDHVTDEAGRTGIAVSITLASGIRIEMIFDATTYGYLGQRTVAVRDYAQVKAGQVLDSSAVLKSTIVDRAGQLP
jgi:hypothetical protein